MRTSLLICLFVLTVPLLQAAKVGDTLEMVLEEKGKPVGQMEAGGSKLLTYSDVSIRFRDNRVVEIKALPPPKPASEPQRQAAPARKVKSTSTPAGELWMTSLEEAVGLAKMQNKKIFLFFTGSDWCGWCMKLDKEILSTQEFLQYAAQDLVLVKLDFPRSIEQPDLVKKQNAYLRDAFKIRGYPTVVVLDSEAKFVGKLGYQTGGPEPFIGLLRQMKSPNQP